MAKKELGAHVPYIAIVGLVGIVAIVVLVLNMGSSADTAGVVDEEDNFVGEAARVGNNVMINANKLKLAPERCPPDKWELYQKCEFIATIPEGGWYRAEKYGILLKSVLPNGA